MILLEILQSTPPEILWKFLLVAPKDISRRFLFDTTSAVPSGISSGVPLEIPPGVISDILTFTNYTEVLHEITNSGNIFQ